MGIDDATIKAARDATESKLVVVACAAAALTGTRVPDGVLIPAEEWDELQTTLKEWATLSAAYRDLLVLAAEVARREAAAQLSLGARP